MDLALQTFALKTLLIDPVPEGEELELLLLRLKRPTGYAVCSLAQCFLSTWQRWCRVLGSAGSMGEAGMQTVVKELVSE